MTFSPLDQETIRAIVREEIALDEMRRTGQAPFPACPICSCMRERAGAGGIPTAPAPNLNVDPDFGRPFNPFEALDMASAYAWDSVREMFPMPEDSAK